MSDLIERQAAIDALEIPKVIDLYDHYWNGRNDQYKKDVDVINNLPSAQPERKYTMEEFMFGQDMGNPEDGSL